MTKSSSSALLLVVILAFPLHSQAPAKLSDGDYIAKAGTAAPEWISKNATYIRITPTKVDTLRVGTNPFVCSVPIFDGADGPYCGDAMATQWLLDLKTRKPKPTNSAPGIAYMAAGGVHYESSTGDLVSRTMAGAIRVVEPPHWMLMWPFNPAATGIPVKNNGTGSYIMDEGSAWAHVMIYQDPMQLAKPPR
jgi:hypothetical protein